MQGLMRKSWRPELDLGSGFLGAHEGSLTNDLGVALTAAACDARTFHDSSRSFNLRCVHDRHRSDALWSIVSLF